MDRRKVIAAGVAGISIASLQSASAEKPNAENPELKKIVALLKAHDDAMTGQNLDGVLACLKGGAAIMGTGPGEMWSGKEEITEAYQHFFTDFDKGQQDYKYLFRVGGLSSDMGWLMTSGTVSGKNGGKDFAYPLSISLTVEKIGGEWKIAAMHYSTLTSEHDKH